MDALKAQIPIHLHICRKKEQLRHNYLFKFFTYFFLFTREKKCLEALTQLLHYGKCFYTHVAHE